MASFSCAMLIGIAVCFIVTVTDASFPPNRDRYPDGYFFGTQVLSCVLSRKRSILPIRFPWSVSHRLIYYRNTVYEFAKYVSTHDYPDWPGARKCPIKWESTPAGGSKCSAQSLQSFVNKYTIKYGEYNLAINNCHIFANRVSGFLYNSKCGR